jgi:hypothetical protein
METARSHRDVAQCPVGEHLGAVISVVAQTPVSANFRVLSRESARVKELAFGAVNQTGKPRAGGSLGREADPGRKEPGESAIIHWMISTGRSRLWPSPAGRNGARVERPIEAALVQSGDRPPSSTVCCPAPPHCSLLFPPQQQTRPRRDDCKHVSTSERDGILARSSQLLMLLDGDENEQNFFMFLHSACQTNNCLFEIRWPSKQEASKGPEQ